MLGKIPLINRENMHKERELDILKSASLLDVDQGITSLTKIYIKDITEQRLIPNNGIILSRIKGYPAQRK